MRTKTCALAEFKAVGEEGTFEAIVSVFGNVDLVGDRVVKGAFADSLKAWGDSGDPIPVVWSHQWDNPMAHIGAVQKAEERDDGLWVQGTVDLSEELGRQVHKLLKDRRVKEWSFAYDVVDEQKADDGANELRQVDLLEVGPTLKGANPATQTLAAKSLTHATARKAGRVLSAKNRAKLVAARDAIDGVLDADQEPEDPGKTTPLGVLRAALQFDPDAA